MLLIDAIGVNVDRRLQLLDRLHFTYAYIEQATYEYIEQATCVTLTRCADLFFFYFLIYFCFYFFYFFRHGSKFAYVCMYASLNVPRSRNMYITFAYQQIFKCFLFFGATGKQEARSQVYLKQPPFRLPSTSFAFSSHYSVFKPQYHGWVGGWFS